MSIDSLQQLDVQIKTLIHAINCYITEDERYRGVAESLKKIDLNAAVVAMSLQLVDAKASAERWSEDIGKGKIKNNSFDKHNSPTSYLSLSDQVISLAADLHSN